MFKLYCSSLTFFLLQTSLCCFFCVSFCPKSFFSTYLSLTRIDFRCGQISTVVSSFPPLLQGSPTSLSAAESVNLSQEIMAIKIYLLKLKRILQEVRKTFSIITFLYSFTRGEKCTVQKRSWGKRVEKASNAKVNAD